MQVKRVFWLMMKPNLVFRIFNRSTSPKDKDILLKVGFTEKDANQMLETCDEKSVFHEALTGWAQQEKNEARKMLSALAWIAIGYAIHLVIATIAFFIGLSSMRYAMSLSGTNKIKARSKIISGGFLSALVPVLGPMAGLVLYTQVKYIGT